MMVIVVVAVAVVGVFVIVVQGGGSSKQRRAGAGVAVAVVVVLLLHAAPAAPAQGSLQGTRTCQMDTTSLAVLSCQEWPPSGSCCGMPSTSSPAIGLCCLCVYIVTMRLISVDLPYVYRVCRGKDAEAVAAWIALQPPPVYDCTVTGNGMLLPHRGPVAAAPVIQREGEAAQAVVRVGRRRRSSSSSI
uniref:Uncharacterized protein n=1 Tax=Oryza glumipatula TaxID=40148 RepID=A0A0E0A3K1_9ORYZ